MTTVQDQAIQPDAGQRTGPDGAPGADGMPPVLSILAAAMTATMLDLGDRTGLNRALAAGPADAVELAERTGGNQRLIAEWLRCLDAAGLLASVGARSQWRPEVVGMLAGPPGSPADLSAGIGLFSALASCVPLVAAAFDSGAVPADRYPAGLATSMQAMSEAWVSMALPELWVPAVAGLADRLAAGGRVAEVGCGAGHALQALGRRYPGLTADGFELDVRQVEAGNRRLAADGLAERLRLHPVDALDGLSGPYDLVLALSVLHDVVDLDSTLGVIADCLAPQGHLLVVESPPLRGPLAAMLLATSTLYCVPSVQARGGPALGTLGLPPEVLIQAASRAGLTLDPPLPPATPLVMAYSFGLSR